MLCVQAAIYFAVHTPLPWAAEPDELAMDASATQYSSPSVAGGGDKFNTQPFDLTYNQIVEVRSTWHHEVHIYMRDVASCAAR